MSCLNHSHACCYFSCTHFCAQTWLLNTVPIVLLHNALTLAPNALHSLKILNYIYNSYTYSTVLHHSSVYGCIFCSAVTASLTFTALCCCIPIASSFTSEGDDPIPLLYGCELELVVERRLYSQSISGVIVHQEES